GNSRRRGYRQVANRLTMCALLVDGSATLSTGVCQPGQDGALVPLDGLGSRFFRLGTASRFPLPASSERGHRAVRPGELVAETAADHGYAARSDTATAGSSPPEASGQWCSPR